MSKKANGSRTASSPTERPISVGILSRERKSYSTKRLVEACRARGFSVRVYDTMRFSMTLDEDGPGLLYRGRALGALDAVIPRVGASITFFGTAVVRQLEQMGVYTLSASQAISVSRDKLRALQTLSRHDIGFPESEFVRTNDAVLPAIARLGGAPVVIKLLEGTQGVGVILAESAKIAESIVETLQSARQNVLLQRFVKESAGRDIRAFVVGGRVVAAMRRQARDGEFRSNVHRGGTTEKVTLSPEVARIAVHAAQVMGLRVAGVDMLEGHDGPLVMEVNSSPGLEGIEGATGVDVAGAIVDQLAEEVLFPVVDLRQRLTLERGYAVVELTVEKGGPLAGRSLAELALRERSVSVLSVRRRSGTIPNPTGATVLATHDVLLCYGKQFALRDLLPRHAQKTRRT
jgi:ribosomal protein S6--L-glutamate ligase